MNLSHSVSQSQTSALHLHGSPTQTHTSFTFIGEPIIKQQRIALYHATLITGRCRPPKCEQAWSPAIDFLLAFGLLPVALASAGCLADMMVCSEEWHTRASRTECWNGRNEWCASRQQGHCAVKIVVGRQLLLSRRNSLEQIFTLLNKGRVLICDACYSEILLNEYSLSKGLL